MSEKIKTYSVPTKFVFKGEFKVKARSRQEAVEFVQNHCGMNISTGVHSSLPDENVDWNFPVHPDKTVTK